MASNPCLSAKLPPGPTKTQMSNLVPPMDFSAAGPAHAAIYRSRDAAAMPNGRRSQRDLPRRHPSQNDLNFGMTTSRRSISPVAAVVNRSSEFPRERERDRDRERERERDPANHHRHQQSRPRSRSIDPSHPPSQHRRLSRRRSPEHTGRPFHPSHHPPRGHRDYSRDLPRGRDIGRSPDRRPPGPGPSGRREDANPRPIRSPQRAASRSPVPSKRPRSQSPSFGGLQPKKPRQDRSPRKLEKGEPKSLQLPNERRGAPLSPRRLPSPEHRHHRDHRPKPKRRSGRSRSPTPPSRRRRRSPYPQEAARQRSVSPRHREHSPLPTHLPRSASRPHSRPFQRGSRPTTASDTGSGRRQSPDRAPLGGFPPGSPRDRRHSKSSKKGRSRDNSRSSKKFDPVSGANSVEVNMAARGGYRGGFNSQPGYPKGPYNDPRGYSQSSGHGTPNSSFHGSPSAQSPYGGSGRGWSGQQQFSPQSSQYQPPYPHSNYGPPTGPQSHYQAHSPPYPPNGPSSQYPSGPYRGIHRGGPGGFRGGQFGPGRGRGNFKNTQWNSNAPNNNVRGQFGSGEETEPSHASGHTSPNHHAHAAQDDAEDVHMEDSDNPFRPSKDLQVEDTSKSDQPKEDQMQPPSREPPTGPQSQTPNKFSFSMKNATKPVVAAPRPEISSKFNAAPPPRESTQKTPPKPAPKPDRDRDRDRERDRDRDRDRERDRDHRDRERDRERDRDRDRERERERGVFPKNVPTEPASARARPNERRPPPEPSRAPEPMSRTRKVKKIMRRLKEKPVLPPDLAKSKSVFFRKPGNESVIGSGTYGKVFKGLNVYTKKLVALKRIRMEGERDGFPVTAVREIKLLRSLSHKNIVQLQEVMVETNECFMVFEYLAHDLTGLLNHPNYSLEPAHRKDLAQQLFEGLDYLHTRGVLHRDIKAANILVSNEGVLKLADFGLARFYAKHHQLDYTNRVITIWYRSPELLLGETQYGPAVDIWSAACVMVEIFTKRAIFPGDGTEISQLEKIHSILGTPNRAGWPNLVEMPWFELLRPNYRKPSVFAEKYKEILTPHAFDLLSAMFQYDPAKRPTAAEVLEHPYFTTEQPAPRQAIELKDIDGEWHEFESKALRRENERKEKEARRMAREGVAGGGREKDRKRPNEATDAQRESKRLHVDGEGRLNKPDREGQPPKPKGNETQQTLPQTSQLPVGGHTKPNQASSSSVTARPGSQGQGKA